MENLTQGLVGHWRFAGDCLDASEIGHLATCRGVVANAVGPGGAADTAAVFDGRGACIEVPDHPSLNFETGDFSIALWAHTEDLGDVVGDIMSKFDGPTRKGFNLGVVSHPGVTSSHSNERNVHFGIDDGITNPGWGNLTNLPRANTADNAPKWADCGRLGNAIHVMALAVFQGELYAGTTEWDADESGHVYRYAGGANWEDCGSPEPCNTVNALAVYDGALYAGTAWYKTTSSCLQPSPNTIPGGRIFRYAGDKKWIDCGRINEADGIRCLVNFKGTLYATRTYGQGVFAWRGGTCWESVGLDARIISLGFWNGKLYAMTSGKDTVYRMESEGDWTALVRPPDTIQLYSFAVFRGGPHVGTWPNADIFRLNGNREQPWQSIGSPGYSKEIMGMAVYNGGLYAGTLPMADVYRYDGSDHWDWTGILDNTPDARLRRAWSMAVYDGKLFCGLLPSGHVKSIEVGRMATYDHVLKPGWRHIAAVREKTNLSLSVDGEVVARSSAYQPEQFNVSNENPLLIGFGAQDYFNGRMSDLRIYNRALAGDEIGVLATGKDNL